MDLQELTNAIIKLNNELAVVKLRPDSKKLQSLKQRANELLQTYGPKLQGEWFDGFLVLKHIAEYNLPSCHTIDKC